MVRVQVSFLRGTSSSNSPCELVRAPATMEESEKKADTEACCSDRSVMSKRATTVPDTLQISCCAAAVQ